MNTEERQKLSEQALAVMENRSNLASIAELMRETKEKESAPSEQSHLVEVKIAKDGGVFSYYEEHPYPRKGLPFAETVEKLDGIKKSLWTVAAVFSKNPVVLALAIFFFRKALYESYWELLRQADRALTYHVIHPERYCRAVRNVYQALAGEERILRNLVCMFLEFDDAYRYRFQDIVGELDKRALSENPYREISRLITLIAEREGTPEGDERMKKRWKDANNLLFVAFFFRGIREKIVGFFTRLDPQEIRMDDGDRYYAEMKRGDYNWGGKASNIIS